LGVGQERIKGASLAYVLNTVVETSTLASKTLE